MFRLLAVTLPESLAGAVAVVSAAGLSGWFTYRAAVANTRAAAKSAQQASVDTTATAQAFDTTVRALAVAAAEATQRALEADAKATKALAGEGQCRAEFDAHKAATAAEIATLRGALNGLAERLAPGAA